jgi:hypothetical protein
LGNDEDLKNENETRQNIELQDINQSDMLILDDTIKVIFLSKLFEVTLRREYDNTGYTKYNDSNNKINSDQSSNKHASSSDVPDNDSSEKGV